MQGILNLNKDLRQLNLEHTGISPQQLAKLNLRGNILLEEVNYACVTEDTPTFAEMQSLSEQLSKLPRLRSLIMSGIKFDSRSFERFTKYFNNHTFDYIEL